jgi:hypothetical protein
MPRDKDTDLLIEALTLEVIATGQSEGTWFGPEWAVAMINQHIRSTGGYDKWVERYYAQEKEPLKETG